MWEVGGGKKQGTPAKKKKRTKAYSAIHKKTQAGGCRAFDAKSRTRSMGSAKCSKKNSFPRDSFGLGRTLGDPQLEKRRKKEKRGKTRGRGERTGAPFLVSVGMGQPRDPGKARGRANIRGRLKSGRNHPDKEK